MVRETFGVGITDTYLIYGAGAGVVLSAHPLLHTAAGRAQPIQAAAPSVLRGEPAASF